MSRWGELGREGPVRRVWFARGIPSQEALMLWQNKASFSLLVYQLNGEGKERH